MKAVILAGGRGTRLAEETERRPKPLVEIGGRPILWHIFNIYARHGITDFVVCLGYKGYLIKEYISNLRLHDTDVTVHTKTGVIDFHSAQNYDWRVTLVDTGEHTMTGGRLKRVREYVEDSTFCMTYGDGVADVDIATLLEFHRSHGLAATVTTVRPPARFGTITAVGDLVKRFDEKVSQGEFTTNGGFFVLEPTVIDLIANDATVWEGEPMRRLAETNQLAAYAHAGFWQCMDTVWERNYLEELWATRQAPWKTW